MKNIVVTGGTSGIGLALARICRDRGDNVLVIAPDPAKGERFIEESENKGAGKRVFFIPADLSLVGENERVIDEIGDTFTTVDALVLCARFFRSYRRVTAEGFEHNFALYYLSRFLLSHGLVEPMRRAGAAAILNVAGPGVAAGRIHWDDLELEHGYNGWEAMFQGGKLNNLLGVSWAAAHGGQGVGYVLQFPGGTRTGLAGEFDPETAAQVEQMKQGATKSAEDSAGPLVDVIDNPPAEPLTALWEDRPISLDDGSFDAEDAARLHRLTEKLLSRR
ncbi:short chain dehydrogenase [Thermomonospora echinospora]|uniref:Short chain dehydrogenase n=1 Tax=Thermomonospora echinospora TaxID=1992 RepID=A0A1H6DZP5_9ACTN|nr:SDR family NAD(P)-dependent oxidoreductase [Thermomonospora echinospora]SEG90323.1 short chain dehydrogenase [Thermomonospora echinospora]